MFEYNR